MTGSPSSLGVVDNPKPLAPTLPVSSFGACLGARAGGPTATTDAGQTRYFGSARTALRAASLEPPASVLLPGYHCPPIIKLDVTPLRVLHSDKRIEQPVDRLSSIVHRPFEEIEGCLERGPRELATQDDIVERSTGRDQAAAVRDSEDSSMGGPRVPRMHHEQ